MISSVARPGPTSAVSRWVPPAPGSRPRRTSGRPIRAPSARAQMRKSQASATSSPPPSAWPVIATTAGRWAVDRAARRRGELREPVDDLLGEHGPLDALLADTLELGDVCAG